MSLKKGTRKKTSKIIHQDRQRKKLMTNYSVTQHFAARTSADIKNVHRTSAFTIYTTINKYPVFIPSEMNVQSTMKVGF